MPKKERSKLVVVGAACVAVLAISGVGSLGYNAVVGVSNVFAFMDKVDSRHNMEDLVQLWAVRDNMLERKENGPWNPRDEDNLRLIRARVKVMEQKLGFKTE